MKKNTAMKKFTFFEVLEITTDMLRNVVKIAEEENVMYCAIYGTLLGAIRHKGPIPWHYDADICVAENEIDRFVKALNQKLPDKYWVNYRNADDVPQKFPRVGLRGYETEYLHVDIFRLVAIPDLAAIPPNEVEKLKRLWKRGVFWSKIWKAKVVDPDYYYEDRKRRRLAKLAKIVFAPMSVNHIIKKLDKVYRKYPFGTTDYVVIPFVFRTNLPIEYFTKTELMPFCDFQIRVPSEYDRILTSIYGDYMKFPPEERRKRNQARIYHIREISQPKYKSK